MLSSTFCPTDTSWPCWAASSVQELHFQSWTQKWPSSLKPPDCNLVSLGPGPGDGRPCCRWKLNCSWMRSVVHMESRWLMGSSDSGWCEAGLHRVLCKVFFDRFCHHFITIYLKRPDLLLSAGKVGSSWRLPKGWSISDQTGQRSKSFSCLMSVRPAWLKKADWSFMLKCERHSSADHSRLLFIKLRQPMFKPFGQKSVTEQKKWLMLKKQEFKVK